MKSEELDELIQKYVLGAISETEFKGLTHHLDHADTRRKLRLALEMDAMLQEAASELETKRPKPSRSSRIRHFLTFSGIAAALILGVFALVRDSGQAEDPGVATVIRIDGEGRVNQESEIQGGDSLHAGDRLSMEDGMIELVFQTTGVHAIATAPLSLTAKSTGSIFLHAGDLKLHVPPQGVGFVVETVERKITDLGTSFVVSAEAKGSKVFVLDGQIAVGARNGTPERLMAEGEVAKFDRNGEMKMRSRRPSGVPELSLPSVSLTNRSLPGMILGYEQDTHFSRAIPNKDFIGTQVMPLIRSGFKDRSCLSVLKKGRPLRFSGIAGTYNNFPSRVDLEPFKHELGWLAWYQGKVVPPQPGRYRFWGYADNQLLVAIDGEPVFEGSRYASKLRETLGIPRWNHPALPCLNAVAGFASGPWVELGSGPIQLDLLFGETGGNLTSGLLLVEREGAVYEETFWGQPKWPLFLTELPSEGGLGELDELRLRMEEKLMGSFSVSEKAVWPVFQK